MKITIYKKLFTSYLLLIAIATFLMYGISMRLINVQQIAQTSSNLAKQAALVTRLLTPEIGDTSELALHVKRLSKLTGTRITVINPSGVVLAESNRDPKEMENHFDRPEVQAALKKQITTRTHYSRSLKQDMLYTATPIIINGSVVAVVRVSVFKQRIDLGIIESRRPVLFAVGMILLLCLIVAYFFSRHFAYPLRELAKAANQISRGETVRHIHIKTSDEVQEAAEAFNNMATQVQASLHSLSLQQQEMQSILSSLSEALWVIEHDETVQIGNESFQALFPNRKVIGLHYWEIFRSPELLKLIRNCLDDPSQGIYNVQIEDKYFVLSTSPLGSTRRNIFILQDITILKEAERMKRDIVANVAHELRTPLTAIKGFTEALEEEATTEQQRYIHIIKKNTERLIAMVCDIQVLSHVEQAREINPERIRLHTFLENTFTLYHSRLVEEGIHLHMNLDEDLAYFWADTFMLEQVFINLIDNALRYAPESDVVVEASNIRNQNGEVTHVQIKVCDKGMGIAAEHIPRLFERFYTVDKSRSRKQGGSGLGLSIVKHIVLLHQGQIEVNSQQGAGTCFVIILPIRQPIADHEYHTK